MVPETSHKGVMLCERPKGPLGALGDLPFKPSRTTTGLEPIGLVPGKETREGKHVPVAKPASISAYYRVWMKEFDGFQKGQRAAVAAGADGAAAKRAQIAAFSAKLRAAVLSGDSVAEFWKPAKAPATATLHTDTRQADLLREVDAFVDAVCREAEETAGLNDQASVAASAVSAASAASAAASAASAASVTASVAASAPAPSEPAESKPEPAAESTSAAEPAPGASKHVSISSRPASARPSTASSSRAGGRGGGKAKPAWALCEAEAEVVAEDDEADLLEFADGLDFDSFVDRLDDPELAESFKALAAQEAEGGSGGGGGNDRDWRRSFVRALNNATLARVSAATAASQARAAATVGRGDGGCSDGGLSVAASCRQRTEATAARIAVASGGSGGSGDGAWDACSVADGSMGVAARAEASSKLRAAEEFLIDNPELRGVHSTASVRAMLGRAEVATEGAATVA
ncbi:hypothetical protein FOA52_011269 [Chlamydomonas sp. UWO 241]|nr:hypothetical protein FOA52_011269 [Chlamydomonas sp. UWO 241]